MKTITTLSLSSLLIVLAPSSSAEEAKTSNGDFLSSIKFSGDLRGRYEFRETDPADASHALTARARIGVTLGSATGFSAFVEGEGTQAVVEDYRSNPTGSQTTRPYKVGNSVISDPNNVELNQAYLQYADNGFTIKAGRQRIIRNGAAFVGNVGWRQNEQTYDAVSLGFKKENFSVSYVYSDRVQRIFGDDANDALPGPPLRDFEGEFHMLDADFKTDFGKVGGYAYLFDVDNNANVGKNNSFGIFGESGGFYGEFAFQDGTSNLAGGDYTALYGHVTYTTEALGGSGTVGVEYLGDHFKTPFATVHAFNGFADTFALQRIGLNTGPGGNYNGITDVYLGYTRKGLPGGLVFKGFLHYFMDGKMENDYGYEADAVLVKKFNDDLTGVFKAAYFSGEDFYQDIKQVSLQLDYKF
ncbi:alginate export family protein [Akkermansiaceae bacterium]|nr:alginate export family protein [Akkermansiaceae bacterium]